MMARVIDLDRVRAALERLDRAVERYPELTSAAARERLVRALATEEKGGTTGQQAGAEK